MWSTWEHLDLSNFRLLFILPPLLLFLLLLRLLFFFLLEVSFVFSFLSFTFAPNDTHTSTYTQWIQRETLRRQSGWLVAQFAFHTLQLIMHTYSPFFSLFLFLSKSIRYPIEESEKWTIDLSVKECTPRRDDIHNNSFFHLSGEGNVTSGFFHSHLKFRSLGTIDSNAEGQTGHLLRWSERIKRNG